MAGMGGTYITPVRTTTTSSTIWTNWVNDTTCYTGGTQIIGTNAVTTSATVWVTWCDSTTITYPAANVAADAARADFARANMQAQADAQERYAESERKRKEAEARAEKLLIENLSLQQRLDYEKTKSFMVKATSGKRYRIRCGRMGNVDMINGKGFVEHRLCAHPGVAVPNPDTMLAQKLMLEVDEPAFLRIANRHAVMETRQVAEALA